MGEKTTVYSSKVINHTLSTKYKMEIHILEIKKIKTCCLNENQHFVKFL